MKKKKNGSQPLKRQEKMHLKMTSAEVVCCKQLPYITDEFKYTGKQGGPRSDCSYRSSLIWVHIVCHRGFLNISADEKQMTFVAIGALTVKDQTPDLPCKKVN